MQGRHPAYVTQSVAFHLSKSVLFTREEGEGEGLQVQAVLRRR